jgi:asparagine synthase (glutamine-hydrolysing)
LRGEFAFVLWDETNRTIFAARDRFGIKPLFYAFYKETLYFASEVKALFAAGVTARWYAESVYHYVEFGGHQMRLLSLTKVFQVPPGHYLIATEKHVQQANIGISRLIQSRPHASAPDADYAAEFVTCWREAVPHPSARRRPVGCYLSGGLDSCAVLGLAARHIRTDSCLHRSPMTVPIRRGKGSCEMAAKAGRGILPYPIRQDDLAITSADDIATETLCFNATAWPSTC